MVGIGFGVDAKLTTLRTRMARPPLRRILIWEGQYERKLCETCASYEIAGRMSITLDIPIVYLKFRASAPFRHPGDC
jgi:hypothetical protein